MRNIIGRLGWVGILLGWPCAALHAQDLPAPAEQVQRQADNPLRWIIEAGKLKGRAAGVDKATARSAAGKAPARAKEAVAASATAPAASASASSAAAATPAPAELVAQNETAAPPPAPAALELVSGGQTLLPDEVWQQLHADAELVLEFTVNTDGSVSDVSVQSSNNKLVDPIAVESLLGWHFKPIPRPQVHGVQLVFHPRD